MTGTIPTSAAFKATVIGLVLATAAVLVVTDGNLAAGLAPALLLAAVYAALTLPLRHTALALFCVTVLFHNPGGRPHQDRWRGPLYGPGELIYNNLRTLVGIDALRFNTIEVGIALLLFVLLVRSVTGSEVDGSRSEPSARPLKVALAISMAALLTWVVWGLARGGDFKQMLWQTRQIGWLPLMTLVFLRAFRTQEAQRRLAYAVIGITVARALEGLYFYLTIARPRGMWLEYAITHDDSMLFVLVLLILGVTQIEMRSRRTLLLAALVAPIVMLAMILNTRRLAYVSMAACAATLLWAVRPQIRRWALRVGLALTPLLAVYVAVGLRSGAAIFAPVRSLFSVTDRTNASNVTRDVENFNLLHTLYQQPFLGTGFGHEYIELVKTHSIAEMMPNYRYIAHNSVLWLLMLTGLIGFTLIWMYLPVGVFLAARAYRSAQEPQLRVAAIAGICMVVIYMFQAYGDMGMISWMAGFLLAAALGVVGNLAARTGAWPRGE